jgi:hypothetical protein
MLTTIVVNDSSNTGIPNATVTANGASAQTTSQGIINLNIPGDVGQTVLVTVTVPGYGAQTQNIVLTTYQGSLSFTLQSSAPAFSTTIVVTDGTNPVFGASVFLNGELVGSTTVTGAAPLLNLTAGLNQLQISATGFAQYGSNIQATDPPAAVKLTAITSTVSQTLSLVSSPPAATLVIGSENGTLGPDGTYTTSAQYAPGNYSVTLTFGAQSTTTSLTVVAGTSNYQLNPVPVADTGSGAGLQTVSPNGAAAPSSSSPGTVAVSNAGQTAPAVSSTVTGVTTPADVPDYEFINPNGGFGRYFTATQARMYIGNLFIEELAGVQFVLQGNKVPIYGYASEAFDALGNGKTLVQGQIMLNFISEGYLYTVLNEYKKSTSSTDATSQQTFANLMSTQQTLQAQNSSDPAVIAQIAAVSKQRQAMLAADPTLASTYKRTTLASATTQVGPNAVYQNVPFDLVLELEGGGRTVTRRISKCVIVSNEQIYGDSDTPLLDSYGFIGRKLR